MSAPEARSRSLLNAVVASLATFVGALALVASVNAAYWQRQSVRAQVWPNIDGFGLTAENAGTGPAEIRSVDVMVDHISVRQSIASWGRSSANSGP